jgi:allantoin racemase
MSVEATTSERAPTRIAVLLGQYPADELELRTNAVKRAAPVSIEIEFRQIEASVYRRGLTNLHRELVAPFVACAAIDAERDGCHAVVPYGTLDLGVEQARHAVSIPVLGPGRTSSNVAAAVSHRFAVLCYDGAHVTMFRRLTREWDVGRHITSIRQVGVEVTEMTSNPDRLRKQFVMAANEVIRSESAELILPLGMTMVPVHLSARELTTELGIPVLDPLALTLRVADSLASSGFVNSRVAYPAADPDSGSAPCSPI